ncbi:MAG: hypothetical protein WAW59_06570 [Patescibacteria group bacterium]
MPRRIKRDFVSWVDQEFNETTLDTPESRVYYVSKKLEQGNPTPDAQSPYIYELEFSLIGVLARMEVEGVAFDRDKLVDI